MRAVVIRHDRPGDLELREVDAPSPSPTQVLIAVQAAGVNRADLAQRQGRYRLHTAGTGEREIAGLELAGTVVEIGRDVHRFVPGDRVMALSPAAYAELAAVEECLALPIPAWCSYEQAAAIPVAFMTEHDALIRHGRLTAGSDVLITAATAGVSLAALQIARAWGARHVFGTTRSAREPKRLSDLGLTHLIRPADNLRDVVRTATDGVGVPLVVDHVGGRQIAACLDAMAVRGRLVSVGRLGGVSAEINLDTLARNRLTIVGVTFRTRGPREVGRVARRMHDDLFPMLESRILEPVIDRVFPLSEVVQAHEYLARGSPFGKVVLSLT